MAVYTEVSDEALEAFLSNYDLGKVLSFKGIAGGVENTNYLLRTEQGNFILTLYEKRVEEADLPFFIGLMDHLASRVLRRRPGRPGSRNSRHFTFRYFGGLAETALPVKCDGPMMAAEGLNNG